MIPSSTGHIAGFAPVGYGSTVRGSASRGAVEDGNDKDEVVVDCSGARVLVVVPFGWEANAAAPAVLMPLAAVHFLSAPAGAEETVAELKSSAGVEAVEVVVVASSESALSLRPRWSVGAAEVSSGGRHAESCLEFIADHALDEGADND
ncbi:hypothetical protein Emag_003638 [Eimeria magna]